MSKAFNNGKYVLNLESDNLCNNFFNKILSEYDDDYENDDYYEDEDDEEDEEDEDFDIEAEDRAIDKYISEHGDEYLHDSDEENKYFSKTDLINTICVLCGGYVAEQIVFNKIYDNMQGVLSNINAILLNMSSQGMFGMEYAFSSYRNEKLPYTPDFVQRLNELFSKTISDCYQVAEKIITKNKKLIEKLIPILVEKSYMDNSVCEPIIKDLGGIIL